MPRKDTSATWLVPFVGKSILTGDEVPRRAM
jgi:hypothetical protein